MKLSSVARALSLSALVMVSAAHDVSAAGDDRRFMYQWTDRDGVAHITDSLQNVPLEHRSRSKRIEQPAEVGADQGTSEQSADQNRTSRTGETADTGKPAGEDDKRFIYQWTDETGVLHITDSLQGVPPEHRSRAKRLDQPASSPDQLRQEQAPDRRDDGSGSGMQIEDDEIKKAEWQQRLLDAKRRLAEAEDRYRQIEERKRQLETQWGSSGAAMPPQNVLDEIKKLETDLVLAGANVERARNELDVVVPDAARKAGIPPGWLREVE